MIPTPEQFAHDRWSGSSGFLLPMEPRGLYREMLTQAWRRGARLPNDPEAIRRACGCTTDEWERCWPLVSRYWREDGADLVNETQVELYAKASGAKGAKRAAPPNVAGPSAATIDAEFDQLWTVCAKKVGRGQARTTYRKLRLAGKLPPIDDLCEALIRRQSLPDWTETHEKTGQPRGYMPHLSTALRKEFWTDEPPGYQQRSLLGPPPPLPPPPELEEFVEIASPRWTKIRALLETALNGTAFDKWIVPLRAVAESADEITVAAPSLRLVHEIEENVRKVLNREAQRILGPLGQLSVTAGRVAPMVVDERRTA